MSQYPYNYRVISNRNQQPAGPSGFVQALQVIGLILFFAWIVNASIAKKEDDAKRAADRAATETIRRLNGR